jgi:hypothetical protein
VEENPNKETLLPTKKKTGLCGSWADERTAEEIIRDIKTNRRWFRGNTLQ